MTSIFMILVVAVGGMSLIFYALTRSNSRRRNRPSSGDSAGFDGGSYNFAGDGGGSLFGLSSGHHSGSDHSADPGDSGGTSDSGGGDSGGGGDGGGGSD